MNGIPRPFRSIRAHRSLLGPLALSASLLSASACSDSPTDTPPDRLSGAEVSDLVDALATVHAFNGIFQNQNPWSCPGGGVADHQVLVVFDAAQIRVDGPVDYQARRVGAWTVDGELQIDVDIEVDHFGKLSSTSGSSEGTIQWERSGRTGQCVIDLSVGFADGKPSISGSACGSTVTAQSVTWGSPAG